MTAALPSSQGAPGTTQLGWVEVQPASGALPLGEQHSWPLLPRKASTHQYPRYMFQPAPTPIPLSLAWATAPTAWGSGHCSPWNSPPVPADFAQPLWRLCHLMEMCWLSAWMPGGAQLGAWLAAPLPRGDLAHSHPPFPWHRPQGPRSPAASRGHPAERTDTPRGCHGHWGQIAGAVARVRCPQDETGVAGGLLMWAHIPCSGA